MVLHSVTKLMAGHSDATLGWVAAQDADLAARIRVFAVTTGLTPSPFDCWLAERGLATFDLRYDRAEANARVLAEALAGLPGVRRVIYPGRPDHPQADVVKKQMSGGSTLICLDLKGGKAKAFAFQNALEVIKISNNLGDAKSLITHPATTTHKNLTDEARAELGMGGGTLRLSVGLEDTDDLIADIGEALDRAG